MPEDHELLRDYAHDHSESAFTELVRRRVDLVYSAALRETHGDGAMAEDITQAVFAELARKASPLCRHPALAGWLYTCVRLMSANARRSNDRRQRREQEAHTMNELLSADSTESSWRQVEPVLDDAMHELSETDRAAVVLRFFEDRSHKEVGLALGLSESAARKRVDRALESLRALLARRGVTIGASGLIVLISTNAVQAAPVGLAITISAASALAVTTFATTATVTATKAITMTTLQKTLVAATIVAASLATPLVIQHQTKASLREENQSLRRQMEQLTGLQAENERLSTLLAQSNDSESRPNNELLRLRGEVGLLRRQTNELGELLEQSQRLPSSLPATEKSQNAAVETEEQSRLSKILWLKAIAEIDSSVREWPAKSKTELLTKLMGESHTPMFFQITGATDGGKEDEVGVVVFIDELKELRALKLARTNGVWQFSDKSRVIKDPGTHQSAILP